MIPVVMDRYDCRLQSLAIGRKTYGLLHEEIDRDYQREDGLRMVVPREGFKFGHTYDFGDNREHAAVAEKIVPPGPVPRQPRCPEGARTRPSEDFGSTFGHG